MNGRVQVHGFYIKDCALIKGSEHKNNDSTEVKAQVRLDQLLYLYHLESYNKAQSII